LELAEKKFVFDRLDVIIKGQMSVGPFPQIYTTVVNSMKLMKDCEFEAVLNSTSEIRDQDERSETELNLNSDSEGDRGSREIREQ
jgi:hypothetical protein